MNAHSRSEPSLTPPADDGPRPPGPGPGMPVQIGRYLILDRLGAGGMGTVYKAYDPQLQRVVALKMPHLSPDAEDSTVPTQRFLREARTAARIDHPHVCRIHDVAEDGGRPYAVMAYVEGQSLAQRLRGGQRYDDPVEAARLVRQVADALDAVHAHGLLHRDLKPANILLDRDGRAILTDFGLARPRLDAEHLTADGAILGTPAFMAPEQAAGRTDCIGPATDVYGLGVVLYRMLTGRLPFQGDAVTVLWKIGNEVPPVPSFLRPDLDPGLEAIVLRAMAPRPEDRYGSARDMSAALEQWLSGAREAPRARAVAPAAAADPAGTSTVGNTPQATLADPTPQLPVRVSSVQTIDLPVKQGPPRQRKPRPLKSRARVIAAALGVLLVGGLLASLALSRSWSRRDEGEQQEPPARVVIHPEPLSWPARAPLSGKALVSHPAALAGVHSWTVETRSPRGPLRALACSPDGAVLAVAGDDGMVRLWRAGSDQLLRILVGHAAAVLSVAWSPDGRYLASAGEDAAIRLWDADTGQPLRTLRGHTAAVESLAWSPDGWRLASAGRDTKVRLWDVREGRHLPITLSHPHEVLRVAWSPDGKRLASAARDVTLRIWDAASGDLLHTLQKDTFPYVFDLAWSADGKVLASAGQDCRLRLWDGTSGRLLSEIPSNLPVLALAWSRRGNRLAAATLRAVQTWDVAGRLVQTIPKEEDIVHAIGWSGDDKTLTTAGHDGAVRSYDTAAGKPAGVLPGHPAGSAAVAWSPGGELAVSGFGDGALRLWAADKARVHLLKGSFSPVAAWSPDGSRLAVAGADHTVRIWEAAGQKWLQPLRGHTRPIASLAWSRGGKLLASGSEDGTARLWDIPERKLQQTLHSRRTGVYSLAWSPEGQRLALGVSPGAVQIWEVGGDRPRFVREEPTALVRAVAWSPDGQLLASAADEPVGLVLMRNAPPADLCPLQVAKKFDAFALAWTSDSKWLATGTSAGLIRFLAAGGESQLELKAHGGPVTALAWSAAGDMLASAGPDGLVRLWIGAFRGSEPGKPEPGPALVPLAADGSLVVSPAGHWAGSPLAERQLVYVVQTDDGQQVLSPQEFRSTHDWNNRPARAIPAGK